MVVKNGNGFFGCGVAVVVFEIVVGADAVVVVEHFDVAVSAVDAWTDLVWGLLKLGFV